MKPAPPPPDNTALLRELNRVKVLFQLRALAAHLGAPPPESKI